MGIMKLGIKLDDSEINWVGMQELKCVGNVLDHIIFEMEEKDLIVPEELIEFKQWCRFKGNSKRENGDNSMWDIEDSQKQGGKS